MNPRHLLALLPAITCWNNPSALAQPPDANYDEGKVPTYGLPDPLQQPDGTLVANAATWQKQRRPEILKLFEEHVYGRSPKPPRPIQFEVTALDSRALGGKATRKEVTVLLLGRKDGPKMDLLLYLPNAATKPVPAFLGLNFYGNHCVHSDPGIKLSTQWMRPTRELGVENHRATEASRGCQASRWQVEMVLERGYALATVYYGDLEPDFSEGWKLGLRAALSPQGTNTVFQPGEWGAIGAWAWGLSRALDYLEQDPAIAAKQAVVMGHSRLGKTALWAGAQDERFAIVISNNSGKGGASLVRRRFGENIAHSVRMAPYWYCPRYRQYADRESALPVDAHELIALMAPRPVYVASATKDLWADPRGEFLAAKNAEPVYRLFGLAGLRVNEMPAPDHAIGDYIGYHLRSGDHDVTAHDWRQYLNFADRHFKRAIGAWEFAALETSPAAPAAAGATSLANASVRYTVPDLGYVILKRGGLEAVVVDNRAVDDAVLPGHRAGYHGIALLRHTRQPRNLFVPAYAGLNFEHIHDGTVKPREVLFEPRHAPMELRVLNDRTAELYQAPTPYWGLESCMRYELLDDCMIELTFECVPRRETFTNGYVGLFWASYIDHPESLDIHFRGFSQGAEANADWLRGVTPAHGTLATHRAQDDQREFAHDSMFPLELPFGFSHLRYAEPWYFGVCRGMAFVQMFRAQDAVRLTQSPSGGGSGCPAWDFQWFIEKPRVGQRYQLVMRAAYVPVDGPGDAASVREQTHRVVQQRRPNQ